MEMAAKVAAASGVAKEPASLTEETQARAELEAPEQAMAEMLQAEPSIIKGLSNLLPAQYPAIGLWAALAPAAMAPEDGPEFRESTESRAIMAGASYRK